MPTAIDSNMTFARRSETMLSVALLVVLALMLIPLPSYLLDLLLTLNLGLTILLMLTTLSAKQPLDLSVFPSLLLLLTLYRLALNVATTRLILLGGDAGKIVTTFGGFVVGGSLVVGLVIFLILIIIQFVVITKGATRISEVNARFVLDAMPGKQMAIDAELNAGTIGREESQARRSALAREAEFYGAMDGASKFVRGDAIAGLIVTVVNLIGGVVLGVSDGLTFGEAVRRYSVLTVGDGLISQIPALIIATTAGILVTKAASEESLGHEIGKQLVRNDRPLWIGAIMLSGIALTPGLPKLPFAILAGGMLFLRRLTIDDEAADVTDEEDPAIPPTPEEEHLGEFLRSDRAGLEIGARLIPLVSDDREKGLTARVASLRKDLTRKHGLWVPSIRIRDDISLPPDAYRILIGNREVARGEAWLNRLLAIDPGTVKVPIAGEETIDPAFGLAARWIDPSDKRRAQLSGYTVVDAMTVVTTHLGEVLRRFAHELLSRDDLKRMLDGVRETAPTIADEIKPETVRIGVLHQVLKRLLQEHVPITDLPRILEAIVTHGERIKEPAELAEAVREELGRDICAGFRSEEGRMRVIVSDPQLELQLRESIHNGVLSIAPRHLEKLVARLDDEWKKATLQQQEVALLADRTLRRPLRDALARSLRDLSVIAYSEVPAEILIDPIAIIRTEEVFETHGQPVERPAAA